MGQKVEKQMEKVENYFPSQPFSEESRNLILFFQICSGKKETVHLKFHSSLLTGYSPRTSKGDHDLACSRNKSLIKASFFNLVQKSLIANIQFVSRLFAVPICHL